MVPVLEPTILPHWPFSTLFELLKQEAQRAVGLRQLPVQVQYSLVTLGAGRGRAPCLASTTGSGRKEKGSTGEEGTKAMCTCPRCLETLLLGKALLLPVFSVIATVIAHAQAVPKELCTVGESQVLAWPVASPAPPCTGANECTFAGKTHGALHHYPTRWLRCGPSSPPHHPTTSNWDLLSFSPHFTSAGFANTGCLKLTLLEASAHWGSNQEESEKKVRPEATEPLNLGAWGQPVSPSPAEGR